MSLRNRSFPLTTATAIVCLLGSAFASAEPGSKADGHPKGHAHRGGLFARLDANHDGKIDRTESRTAATKHFAEMDENGDGKVTKDEKAAAPRQGKGPHEDKHFARMDENGDGKIEKAEALAHVDRMFADLDGNKDGAVTRDEAHAGLSARHHGKRGAAQHCDGAGPKAHDKPAKTSAQGQAV
jgi:Ca2+-binding EF-hand superfamily protein